MAFSTQNALMAWVNSAIPATLSGGNWESTLHNVKERELSLTANSASLAETNLIINVDLLSNKPSRIWGICSTNASRDAVIRIIASRNSDFSDIAFDTGFVNFYPAVYASADLEWADDAWWSGKYTDSELEGYKKSFYLVREELSYARYMRIMFKDPTNPAGTFTIGRIFIGDYWQAEYNLDYGYSLQFNSNSIIDKSLGQVLFADARPMTRVQRFTLSYMSDAEAFTKALEVVRKSDIFNEVIFIPNKDDTLNFFRTAMLARFVQLSALEKYRFATNRMPFELEELV